MTIIYITMYALPILTVLYRIGKEILIDELNQLNQEYYD